MERNKNYMIQCNYLVLFSKNIINNFISLYPLTNRQIRSVYLLYLQTTNHNSCYLALGCVTRVLPCVAPHNAVRCVCTKSAIIYTFNALCVLFATSFLIGHNVLGVYGGYFMKNFSFHTIGKTAQH